MWSTSVKLQTISIFFSNQLFQSVWYLSLEIRSSLRRKERILRGRWGKKKEEKSCWCSLPSGRVLLSILSSLSLFLPHHPFNLFFIFLFSSVLGFKHLFNWRESCFWSTFLSLQFRINTSSFTSFFLHPSPTHFPPSSIRVKVYFPLVMCSSHPNPLFTEEFCASESKVENTFCWKHFSPFFFHLFLTRIFLFTLHSFLPSLPIFSSSFYIQHPHVNSIHTQCVLTS